MNASYDYTRARTDRGPSIYYGYCGQTRRYRMMDLPDFMTNMQQGMSQAMTDAQTAYQDMMRGYTGPGTGSSYGTRGSRPHVGPHDSDCGCGCHEHHDCHCECCITDADVVVHARCGEVRRIPVTFENDSRRERQVKLQLEKFVTQGGTDVQWATQLSETEFTLKPCDHHTVTIAVLVRCDTLKGGGSTDKPTPQPGNDTSTKINEAAGRLLATDDRLGGVDRCEVIYATLRAEGCVVRPVVIAVAILPSDCDAYRRPCSCGCCH